MNAPEFEYYSAAEMIPSNHRVIAKNHIIGSFEYTSETRGKNDFIFLLDIPGCMDISISLISDKLRLFIIHFS